MSLRHFNRHFNAIYPFRSSTTKEITPKSNWCPDIYVIRKKEQNTSLTETTYTNIHTTYTWSAESKRCNTEKNRTQTTTPLQYITHIAAIIEIRRATGHIIHIHTHIQRYTYTRTNTNRQTLKKHLLDAEVNLEYSGDFLGSDWERVMIGLVPKPKKTHTKRTHTHTHTQINVPEYAMFIIVHTNFIYTFVQGQTTMTTIYMI